MKREIVIAAVGILLLLGLAAATSGERVVSGNERPAAVEPKPQTHRLAEVSITPVPPSVAGGVITGDFPFAAHAAADADSGYHIPWMSINAGGGVTESPSYLMSSSVAQALIGECTSDNYGAGSGYWYGADTDCACGDQFGDITCDGAVNPVDVVYMVNFVYKNIDDRCTDGWNCAQSAGDVNCDDGVNPVDVVLYVNYVYKNITPFACDPCA